MREVMRVEALGAHYRPRQAEISRRGKLRRAFLARCKTGLFKTECEDNRFRSSCQLLAAFPSTGVTYFLQNVAAA